MNDWPTKWPKVIQLIWRRQQKWKSNKIRRRKFGEKLALNELDERNWGKFYLLNKFYLFREENRMKLRFKERLLFLQKFVQQNNKIE
jgi:hypothetical protein